MKRLLTNSVVLHHTTYPQDFTKKQTINAITRDHGKSLYHIIIGHDFDLVMRDGKDVTWHAGNWPVNLTSVAIALNGDFTQDIPTQYQLEKLGSWIRHLLKEYNLRKDAIKLHKEVRLWPTACPGFGHDLVNTAIRLSYSDISSLKNAVDPLFKQIWGVPPAKGDSLYFKKRLDNGTIKPNRDDVLRKIKYWHSIVYKNGKLDKKGNDKWQRSKNKVLK